jgi:hypothetical protein
MASKHILSAIDFNDYSSDIIIASSEGKRLVIHSWLHNGELHSILRLLRRQPISYSNLTHTDLWEIKYEGKLLNFAIEEYNLL